MEQINERIKKLLLMKELEIDPEIVHTITLDKLILLKDNDTIPLKFINYLGKRKSLLEFLLNDLDYLKALHETFEENGKYDYYYDYELGNLVANYGKLVVYLNEEEIDIKQFLPGEIPLVLKKAKGNAEPQMLYQTLFICSKTKNFEHYVIENYLRTAIIRCYRANIDITLLNERELRFFTREYANLFEYTTIEEIKKITEITSNPSVNALLRKISAVKRNFDFRIPLSVMASISNKKTMIKKITSLSYSMPKYYFKNFLEYWALFGYRWTDINKLYALNDEKKQSALENASYYAEYIYNDKCPNHKGSDDYYWYGHYKNKQIDLIIYALINNKKGFLNLVNTMNEENEQDNYKYIMSLPESSILFERRFYEEMIDINFLTMNDIEFIEKIRWSKTHVFYRELEYLKVPITIGELRCLSKIGVLDLPRYIDFLNQIKCASHIRLNTLRSLCKSIIFNTLKDADISTLAVRLSEKTIEQWNKEELYHILNLSVDDTLKALLSIEKYSHLIAEAINSIHIDLIYQNRNNPLFDGIQTLLEFLEKVDIIDAGWNRLNNQYLKLDLEFISKNRDGIRNFCLSGQTYMSLLLLDKAHTKAHTKAQSEFVKIIKAEILGKLKTLKYYGEDICRELRMPVSDKTMSEWKKDGTKNVTISNQTYVIKEEDDFYATMMCAVRPYRTCMAYDSPDKHALSTLSNFDSNKKIINIYSGTTVIGRAIIRLTKGCYKTYNQKVSFADPTKIDILDIEETDNKEEQGVTEDCNEQIKLEQLTGSSIHMPVIEEDEYTEKLIVFLERPYFSAKYNLQLKLMTELISFVKDKACSMGVEAVISTNYNDLFAHKEDGREPVLDTFKKNSYCVFISVSKTGLQYLDSLGGKADSSSEGMYHIADFFVPLTEQPELKTAI